MAQILESSFISNQDELCYTPLDDPEWDYVFDNYSCDKPKDIVKFMKEYEMISQFLIFKKAMKSRLDEDNKYKSSLF